MSEIHPSDIPPTDTPPGDISSSNTCSVPEAIVLLHGIWCHGFLMRYLARKLREQGYRTYCFSFASLWGEFEDNAQQLSNKVAAVPEPIVHVAAHSYGGLVALRMLELRPLPQVKKLVLLGSPVRGASLASRLPADDCRRWILGRAIRSPLMSGLSEQTLANAATNRLVGVVTGTTNRALLGLIFGKIDAGDGLVRLPETHVPGAVQTELAVSHSAMLVSADVAAIIAQFVRFGHFHKAADEATGDRV